MQPPPDNDAPAPAGLFDPARHEPLTATPWSEDAARAAIDQIVADALHDRGDDGLWPAHPQDDPGSPDDRYSMLYLGAGGIVWALRRLQALGAAAVDVTAFDALVPTLVDRNRSVGETALGGTASYFLGDSSLLLLQWQCGRDAAVEGRLHDVVQGNLRHPAREALWGSPGTLLAAAHMADATSDPRWAALLGAGVRILLEEMVFDERIAAWIWQQNLSGRTCCQIGAAHGLAGNFYAVLRAAKWLPPTLVAELEGRALQTLQALALRADGCANWHPEHDPPRAIVGRLPLLQDCHGAPGIVCRLAGAPRTLAWDELLVEAGTLIWRAGPLVKGSGLCHGTAGNGYALLKLWTRTGDPTWLGRARAFAMHAAAQVAAQRAASGQARHSLWTGDIGVALYLQDCISGDSGFPTLDVF
jgi:hypothetical protein